MNNQEIKEAIARSGYLLESQVASYLRSIGFFVDTNQVIQDEITGKAREIDIIAEFYEHNEETVAKKVYSKIQYVMELKNNPYPVVLINSFKFSPLISEYLVFRERLDNMPIDWNYLFWYENLLEKIGSFTQYCSFEKKKNKDKNEFVAFHPAEMHESLTKIVKFCDEQIKVDGNDKTDIMRAFLYLPVLVLGGELYEMQVSSTNKSHLKKVHFSGLVYNYYKDGQPDSILIPVVSKKGFKKFISYTQSLEKAALKALIACKKS